MNMSDAAIIFFVGLKDVLPLMQGGIIARIARDVTEPGSVLDGPLFGDSLICKHNGLYFVDDQLTESDKHIICGVYFTQTKQSPEGERLVDGAIQQLSWWPQDSLWNTMGCFFAGGMGQIWRKPILRSDIIFCKLR